MKAKQLSASEYDGVIKVASTNSASPTDIHVVSNGKTHVTAIYYRNTSASAVTLYTRVKDGATAGDYRQFDLAAGGTSGGYSILEIEFPLETTGNDKTLQAYASSANVVHLKGKIVEVNNG